MNLPKTSFKMKAGLAQKEPERLKKWEEMDLYHEVLKKNEGHESFVLHDGPPYANGPIHIGHALNKVLKDIIVKYKSMQGFYAPYVPGWDCHGLPIENKVEEQLGEEKMEKISTATFRKICREYAEKQVDGQRAGFKRLGVQGEWSDPYLTFTPEYEAGNIEVFKRLYLSGAVYRGRKPIHWCSHCHTALAEAEIEYSDEVSPAIFVRFEVTSTPEGLEEWANKLDVAIWTTTPWTLPANQAVILHPEADYVAVVHEGRAAIFAQALAEKACEKFGWEYELVADASGEPWTMTGAELAGNVYKQPIFGGQGETGKFIYADYVTLEDGTGIVHSAPGHGVDDYNAGMKFDIPIVMPVDDNGCYYKGEGLGTGGPWSGMEVNEANPHIIDWLREQGTLILHEDINHSYPHCWRCKEPVIFRATTQWFVSMDKTGLRAATTEQINNNVQWVPGWASNRIGTMVADRPDWCISRQRYWGVPIPVFTCADCGETTVNEQTLDAVIALFKEKGADAWYTTDAADILGDACECGNCGSHKLEKENDVLDVWWESGVSHTSVCEARDYLRRPADLYLEGSDQHRGWFQSSILTSVGAYGIAPYKAVMSCGFTVDENGRKMSKSLGNGIDPIEVCDDLGADVLRLWVGSVDYSQDVAVGKEILQRTSEAYRRIRNTFRYLLSNLNDFSFDDYVSAEDMHEFDRWALARLAKLVDATIKHYDEYHFHSAFRGWYDFIVSISSEYFDAVKDRLYADAPDSVGRRSAQTVLANMLEAMIRQFAPILTFTCDEVWEKYPEGLKGDGFEASVQLADWFTSDDIQPALGADRAEALLTDFEQVMAARDAVMKAIEEIRNSDGADITKSQEASAKVAVPADHSAVFERLGADALAEVFVVSAVDVEFADGAESYEAAISSAAGEKCPRCWNYRRLGEDDLCERCHEVVANLPEDAE